MTPDERSTRERLDLLLDDFAKLLKKQKTSSKAVHHLRTTARRIESVVNFSAADHGSRAHKTMQHLASLRKAAGKVRDLDVITKLLATVTITGLAGERRRLSQALATRRDKAAGKLRTKLGHEGSSLEKRLRKLDVPHGKQQVITGYFVQGALNRFSNDMAKFDEITEANLHDFRKVCKRTRYIAEIAEGDETADGLIAELKTMQDVIGDWHDWLQLNELARDILAEPDAPLIVAIRANRRAKYDEALVAVIRGREQLILIREQFESTMSTKQAEPRPGTPKPPAKATLATSGHSHKTVVNSRRIAK
jgi:CHAD domain-containing protein